MASNPTPANPPRLILCAGGMGSGKSRVIEHLLREQPAHVIGFDHFAARETVDYTRHFHDEKLGANRDGFLTARQAKFDHALDTGEPILMETHLDNIEQIRGFVEAARSKGYAVELHSVLLTPYTFMQLRKHKDSITDKTASGMDSHTNFMAARTRLPFPVDHEQVYERIYNAHTNGVRPIGPERIAQLERYWSADTVPLLEPPFIEDHLTLQRSGAQLEGRVTSPDQNPALPTR